MNVPAGTQTIPGVPGHSPGSLSLLVDVSPEESVAVPVRGWVSVTADDEPELVDSPEMFCGTDDASPHPEKLTKNHKQVVAQAGCRLLTRRGLAAQGIVVTLRFAIHQQELAASTSREV